MNHGRNASVLRAVRRLRQVELQDLRSTSEGVEPKRE